MRIKAIFLNKEFSETVRFPKTLFYYMFRVAEGVNPYRFVQDLLFCS